MIFKDLKNQLDISPIKIFIFLFFNCAYLFLTFWITTTLFLFLWPFSLLGILMFLSVSVFHKVFSKITSKNEKQYRSTFSVVFISILIIHERLIKST